MNKVILTGNLCRDIELKQTQSGKAVLSNCVAVQRDFKNANNEYESDFINITVWGASAEYLAKYGNKGDRVELVGKWRVDTVENNGDKQYYHKCEVEQIKVFSREKKEEKDDAPAPNLTAIDDTDLPF
jgi:single-strand DNA-binding protein